MKTIIISITLYFISQANAIWNGVVYLVCTVRNFFERSLKLGTLKSLTSVYKNIKVAI